MRNRETFQSIGTLVRRQVAKLRATHQEFQRPSGAIAADDVNGVGRGNLGEEAPAYADKRAGEKVHGGTVSSSNFEIVQGALARTPDEPRQPLSICGSSGFHVATVWAMERASVAGTPCVMSLL